ncbi:MAG TPA: MFS transporter [Mesorhizobium sp.]|jgi:MFS family permease|uniref:MFS transporter n=1 Tax=Mesorhizobium sp. TaxID=1871066 RepID=UPI002DDD87CE|nr:MFS transporter [Mesorhizobium sp.]HEV2506023.1 MFS transporter [Mesorhizobium sp.]
MTSTSPLEEKKLTRRLALGVMSIGFGQSAFIVLVPLVMARLGLTTFDLGLAVAAGTLAFLIGAPFWGSAGNRVGHGRMIRLLGLAMLAAQLLLVIQLAAGPTTYAIATAGLILSRLIYGFAAAGVMPAAQAWLAGTVEAGRRQAAFGFMSAGLNFGRLAGSVAGAAAAIAAPLTVALFMLAPLMLWLTPKGAAKVRTDASTGTTGLSPFDKRILPFLLIGACMTAGFGQVQIMLGPLLQSKLGLDAAQATAATGAALALVAVTMITVQTLVLPRLRWSERSGILAGTGLVVAGMAGLAIASNYGVGALALVATGFGTALATPAYTAWLARRVDPHEQGAAAGWLSSAHIVGQTAGALMGGSAFQLAAELPLLGCAGLALAAAAIAAALDRRGGTQG